MSLIFAHILHLALDTHVGTLAASVHLICLSISGPAPRVLMVFCSTAALLPQLTFLISRRLVESNVICLFVSADGSRSGKNRVPKNTASLFTTAAQSASKAAAAQPCGVFTGSGQPFSMGGGATQKARRPNSHRRPAAAQPAAQQPFTVPSNPPFAPAPIRPHAQRPPQPKSSTWGPPPPPSPTMPAAAALPKARPSVSPHQQFRGAAGGSASSPAQRKPHRTEGAHSKSVPKQSQFMPQQPPSSSAATGWAPHVWGHTNIDQRNDVVSPPATSATFAAASSDSKSGLNTSRQAAGTADSAGSQPPVFAAGASSAAAARPNRVTGYYAACNLMTFFKLVSEGHLFAL